MTLLSLGVTIVAVAVITVAVMVILIRRGVLRLTTGSRVPSRTDPHIGAVAVVTQPIDPVGGGGRVVVAGEDWAARSTESIPAGARVTVMDADGIVLLVEKTGENS